jgi:hypothetical protein
MSASELMMTAEEVLRVHREIFYRSLLDQTYEALADLYANDYMLVRSDGAVLNKESVLRDLKIGGLTFTSIELVDEDVRIYGETAILTGESRTVARRDGKQLVSRFRLVAVYASQTEAIRLVHFQSTALHD